MNVQSDIAVYDNTGTLVFVSEVKNKLRTDRGWATKLRRNMIAHGQLPLTPFFLLALPDRFYLWKLPQHTVTVAEFEAEPDYEVDPIAFKQYAQKMNTDLDILSESGFELLLISWLRELARGTETVDEAVDWLTESGLLEAIRHGNVVTEAVL